MVKTLIMFELFPEEVLLAVDDLTQEEYDLLLQAHKYYTNASDFDEKLAGIVDCISSAFCTDPDHVSDASDNVKSWFGRFADKRVTDNDLRGATNIIVCGFLI